MNTKELLTLIGEPERSVVITGSYGNATLHANGYVSCDPCYLPGDAHDRIRTAFHAKYPWEGYDHNAHHAAWHEFTLDGITCYARDHEDGTGYFGNNVDAGWIVVLPAAMVDAEVLAKLSDPHAVHGEALPMTITVNGVPVRGQLRKTNRRSLDYYSVMNPEWLAELAGGVFPGIPSATCFVLSEEEAQKRASQGYDAGTWSGYAADVLRVAEKV